MLDGRMPACSARATTHLRYASTDIHAPTQPERLRFAILYMNLVSALTLVSMMIWTLATAHGAGTLLSAPATVQGRAELGWGIVSATTAVVGSIAVGLTNQPDYVRFARRPGDQVLGQYSSIVVLGVAMPLFGCLASSASREIYGVALWNPPDLVQRWLDADYSPGARAAAFFAGAGLVVCQLAINTIDNAFSTGSKCRSNPPCMRGTSLADFVGGIQWIWQVSGVTISTFVGALISVWSSASQCVPGSSCRRQASSSASCLPTASSSAPSSASWCASTGC